METSENNSKQTFLTILLALIIFYLTCLSALTGKNDYPAHTMWVLTRNDFFHFGTYFKTHVEPLWHICTKILSVFFRIPLDYSGAIVSGLCNVVVYLLFVAYMGRGIGGAFFACAGMLVCAMYIPWYNEHMYLGQSSPNVWHNPTILMVRPIGFFIFVKIIQIIDYARLHDWHESALSYKDCFILAASIILSGIAKPCFIQILFPSLFFYAIYLIIASKGKVWRLGLRFLYALLPSLLLVLIQVWLLWGGNHTANGSGGIGISWFAVSKIWAPNIFFSTVLVTAFPLSILVIAVLSKTVTQEIIFSWILLVVAFIQKSALIERSRPDHGNFGWAYILALFLVFAVSIRTYYARYFTTKTHLSTLTEKIRFAIPSVLLCLHFLCGITYIHKVIVMGDYH